MTGVNYGRMSRDNAGLAGGPLEVLRGIAQQRTAEVRGEGEQALNAALPPSAEVAQEIGDIDVIEAYDYYCTPRAQHENAPATFDVSHGASTQAWDAFAFAEDLLDQPLLVVGDKKGGFGAYGDGQEIHRRAASTDKQLVVLEGASHYDIYDQPNGAGEALKHAIPFFTEKL